jgi:predicted ATPase
LQSIARVRRLGFALVDDDAILRIRATHRHRRLAEDRLASVKDVAQIGAAIGREFSYALISAVAALPERHLNAALTQLVHAELIFQRGVPPDATYQFKHALVQDAAYASLVRSRRQQLHGRVGRALVEQFPEAADIEPEIVAHHYAEAGQPDAAIYYWQKAGERAIRTSAYAEAVKHLTNGVALLQQLPSTMMRRRQELESLTERFVRHVSQIFKPQDFLCHTKC